MANIGEYVDKYLQIRERKKELEARHKDELAPLNQALDALEDLFQKSLDASGLEQLKTGAGTAYKSTLASVKTADKEAFLDWVKQNDAWHLLDIRAAKTACEDFVEQTGSPPPGVSISHHLKINVRKS